MPKRYSEVVNRRRTYNTMTIQHYLDTISINNTKEIYAIDMGHHCQKKTTVGMISPIHFKSKVPVR
jgi:hypothetical protein